MFDFIRRNKIKTLEPRKDFIENDIYIEDYDMLSTFTVIAIPVLFLVSLKVFMMIGSF